MVYWRSWFVFSTYIVSVLSYSCQFFRNIAAELSTNGLVFIENYILDLDRHFLADCLGSFDEPNSFSSWAFIGSNYSFGHNDLHIFLKVPNQEMMETLQSLGAFREKHIQWMFPHGTQFDFNLRLDSRVFIYKTSMDNVLVHEVYDILNQTRVNQRIGSYPDNMKLKSLVSRRQNLNGITLRGGRVDYRAMGRPELAGKFGLQHFDSLEKMLNFSTIPVYPKSGWWGNKLPNNEWDGIIKLLKDREVDISQELLSSTEDRDLVITISFGVSLDIVSLVARVSQENKANYWSYLEILVTSSWITYIVIMGITLGVMTLVFCEPWWDILGQLGQMSLMLGSSLNPRKWSQHVSFLWVFTLCFVMFAFYSALLTSTMTFSTATIDIKNFDDVHRLGYKVVSLESSMMQQFLATNSANSELQKLSGITVFCNMDEVEYALKTQDKTVGFMTNDLTFPGLVSIGDQYYKFPGGFAFPKDTELNEVFDNALLRLKEFGIIPPMPTVPHIRTLQNIASDPVPLEFAHVGILFSVLALGITFAFIVILLEYYHLTTNRFKWLNGKRHS